MVTADFLLLFSKYILGGILMTAMILFLMILFSFVMSCMFFKFYFTFKHWSVDTDSRINQNQKDIKEISENY